MFNFKRFFSRLGRGLSNRFRGGYRRTSYFIQRRPMLSFFAVLAILLILIVLSNFLTPKTTEPEREEITKDAQIYKIGQSPKVTLQAKIEKSGVIKINALAPGVIQSIKYYEGETVKKGTVLINMSSNYQGGNAASLQRQLAATQYRNAKETLDSQKEIIQKQREVTEKSEASASDLRVITDQSLGETRDLINLNQSIVDTLATNQRNLENEQSSSANNNPGGINDAAILQLRSQRAGVQAGLNQLRAGLRQAEYSASNDKPPAELARLQKDIALKQLELQEKALNLGLEVSRLQLAMAAVNEALYFPAVPFDALIQRVHVKEGQNVNPGTPLFTISAVEDPITAIINLPHNLAGAVSSVEPSILHIDDQTIELIPTFISTEATDGVLYSVLYVIPDTYSPKLVDGGNINVEIPVGISQQEVSSKVPFVPLDSVYQSANESIVLVVEGERAVSKKIELGDVFGRFVEVKNGLLEFDQVILNRNILAGDKVSIRQ